MDATTFTFPTSAFPPLAVGFFGLGTGYLIYGPQELWGRPGRSRAVDVTTGLWGIWMPGFMQFFAGVYLFAALVWFHSLDAPPLYMAALAFTAYGVHWWAIGLGRALGGDPRPNAYMCVAFTLISLLGGVVFSVGSSRDVPVALLFAGLTCVYVTDFVASYFHAAPTPLRAEATAASPELVSHSERRPIGTPLGVLGERALGLSHLVTGTWLLYLTWATALNFASGFKLWL